MQADLTNAAVEIRTGNVRGDQTDALCRARGGDGGSCVQLDHGGRSRGELEPEAELGASDGRSRAGEESREPPPKRARKDNDS